MIEELNLDINRCKKVIEENNYLEIVIAIEELQDKYKNKVKSINENYNDVVWNYNKEDLKNIKEKLIEYQNQLILKEKIKNIYDKISELRLYIENNNINKKDDLEEIINLIENVHNKQISLDEKYDEIKSCLSLLSAFDRKTSAYILELVTLVIK